MYYNYRPQTKFAKVMFLQVSVCPHRWGHAWFYLGGMRGFIWGACMILFGGHAWFYWGGVHGFIWGCAWFYLGVCMVLFGGACMVLFGGACVVFLGGVHVFFSFFGYNEIRSMSGRYASYWNAFLFIVIIKKLRIIIPFFWVINAHKTVGHKSFNIHVSSITPKTVDKHAQVSNFTDAYFLFRQMINTDQSGELQWKAAQITSMLL